jgi:hypothetical protein
MWFCGSWHCPRSARIDFVLLPPELLVHCRLGFKLQLSDAGRLIDHAPLLVAFWNADCHEGPGALSIDSIVVEFSS